MAIDERLRELIPEERNDISALLYVTLNVGGALISGYLASEERYYEGVEQDFLGSYDDAASEERATEIVVERYRAEGRDPDRTAIEDAMGTIRELLMERITRYDGHEEPPRHIHLSDVSMRVPGEPGTIIAAPWWRGRLEAVDGFFMGGLGDQEDLTEEP